MRFDVRRLTLAVQVIRIEGRFDASWCQDLKAKMAALIFAGDNWFVIDLRETSFIDSTALGVLVGILRAARDAGGRVVFVSPQGSAVRSLLAMVRFDQVFELYDTLNGALAQFKIVES